MVDLEPMDVQVCLGRGTPRAPMDELRKKSTISPRQPLTHLPITFNNDDLRGIYLPHDDALVVSVVIANFNVQSILVDNGSSTDILFISAFDKMKIRLGKLHPFPHSSGRVWREHDTLTRLD